MFSPRFSCSVSGGAVPWQGDAEDPGSGCVHRGGCLSDAASLSHPVHRFQSFPAKEGATSCEQCLCPRLCCGRTHTHGCPQGDGLSGFDSSAFGSGRATQGARLFCRVGADTREEEMQDMSKGNV